MSFLESALTMGAVVLAVNLLPKVVGRKAKSTQARIKDNGDKSIDVNKFIYWGIYTVAGLFIFLGVWVYFSTDEPIAGLGFIFMGLVFILPMALLQFADTSVDWSPEYIWGAKSGFNIKKNKVYWDDIVSVIFHPNYSIQVKDKSEKSVYWSVYYSGWYEIVEDLRALRPDLDFSDFDN